MNSKTTGGNKGRVAVAMSGGVDSSVAAFLLKDEGYDVFGVTMDIRAANAVQYSPLPDVVGDASNVAESLGIPHYVFNVGDVFKTHVVDYFMQEYLRGRTPNPCTACNPLVKFGALADFCHEKGAEYFATGHYAMTVKLPNGRYSLKTAGNSKDQTYMLYALSQKRLERFLTPCGAYTKDEIRKIASENGIITADKPDSQEICFIPDNDYAKFIKENSDAEIMPGNFTDADGSVIGRHLGAPYYTVGQRKGLGAWFGKPMYVRRIDIEKNEIELSDDAGLYLNELCAENVNFMGIEAITGEIRAKAKIRYAHKPADCTARMEGETLRVFFDEPQRAITPGQAAVLYDGGGILLCGGTIVC